MEEENFHLWRPSVITAKDPDQNNAYFGNVVLGTNATKTETLQQINSIGEEFVSQVVSEGNSKIREIADLLVKYKTVADVLDTLYADFYEAYGEPDPEESARLFELGASRLASGILG